MISNIIRNFNMKEDINVGPYLEFKSSTAMTITPNYTNTGVTLQYSLDKVTWTNISAKAVTPSASVIYFRGSATGTKSLYTSSNGSNAWIFTNATNLEVKGNITTLIQDILGNVVVDIALGINAFAHMFYNCTALLKAPELPSTILAKECYISMFNGCTSLVTAPALPATTLADSCYSYMFYNCSKIKISTTKVGSYINDYRVPIVGTGIVSTNSLTDMFTGTGGTFKGTPTINTTYYTENTVV